MVRNLVVSSILVIMMVISCGKQDMSYVVRVGENVILEKEQVLRRIRPDKIMKMEDDLSIATLKDFIETRLIEDLLFQAEGFRIGLYKNTSVIQKVDKAKRNIVTRRDGLLYNHIMSKQIETTDEEVRALYEAQDEEFRLAQIVVKSESLADSLYRALQRGANFSELAAAFSTDRRTKRNGGEMRNYFTKGEMPPEVEDVVFSLKIGQISKPANTRSGYHIVKVLERRHREQQPFDQVEEALRNLINQNKTASIVQDYINDLYDKYELKVDMESAAIMLKAKTKSERTKREVLRKALLNQEDVNRVLVQYKGGTWTIADGIDKLLSEPWARNLPLNRPEDIRHFIEQVMTSEFLWLDAVELGFDKDSTVIIETSRSERSIVGRECRLKMVTQKVTVSDDEVRAKYDIDKGKYGNKKFEQVARKIRNELRVERNKNALESALTQLRRRHKITYNKEALQELLEELNELKDQMAATNSTGSATQPRPTERPRQSAQKTPQSAPVSPQPIN